MSVDRDERAAFAAAQVRDTRRMRSRVPSWIGRGARRAAVVCLAGLVVAGGAAGIAPAAGAQVPTARPDTSGQPHTTSVDSAAAAAYADTLAGTPSRKHVRVLSAQRDSVTRRTARLGAVTVTATPVEPTEPVSAVTVTPDAIAQRRRTLRTNCCGRQRESNPTSRAKDPGSDPTSRFAASVPTIRRTSPSGSTAYRSTSR